MTEKPSILLATKEEDMVELIYICLTKKSGRWGRAVNLGPLVNTPFDEESPRIYDDSVLFFSSNGWPGYGKADIFKCKIVDDSYISCKSPSIPG